eukprot:1156388-Pelagomonas_calceolata.AAC.3
MCLCGKRGNKECERVGGWKVQRDRSEELQGRNQLTLAVIALGLLLESSHPCCGYMHALRCPNVRINFFDVSVWQTGKQ